MASETRAISHSEVVPPSTQACQSARSTTPWRGGEFEVGKNGRRTVVERKELDRWLDQRVHPATPHAPLHRAEKCPVTRSDVLCHLAADAWQLNRP